MTHGLPGRAPKLSISSLFVGGEVEQPLIGDAWSSGVRTDEGIVAERHRYRQGQVAAVIETFESQGDSVAVADYASSGHGVR